MYETLNGALFVAVMACVFVSISLTSEFRPTRTRYGLSVAFRGAALLLAIPWLLGGKEDWAGDITLLLVAAVAGVLGLATVVAGLAFMSRK